MDESTSSDEPPFETVRAYAEKRGWRLLDGDMAKQADGISANFISDEKLRLQGQVASLGCQNDLLKNAIQQIAEHSSEAAQRGEPIAAGFALGRIIEICASCAEPDEVPGKPLPYDE